MNIENCLENLNEEASYAMIQLLATSNSEETLDELVDYLVDKFESADDLAEFDRYELTIKDKGEEIYNSYEVWPTILENPNISTTSMLKIIDTFGDVFSQYDIGFRSNMDIEVAEKILQLSTDFYTIGTLVKMYLFSQHVYDTLIERFKNKELTLFINEYAHSTDLSRNFDLDLEYILTGYSVGLRLDFLIWWEQNRNHFIVSSYRPGDDSLHYVVKMLRVVFKPMNPTKTYDLYEEDDFSDTDEYVDGLDFYGDEPIENEDFYDEDENDIEDAVRADINDIGSYLKNIDIIEINKYIGLKLSNKFEEALTKNMLSPYDIFDIVAENTKGKKSLRCIVDIYSIDMVAVVDIDHVFRHHKFLVRDRVCVGINHTLSCRRIR